MVPLIDELQRIKAHHRPALKKTIARVVLGPSVMRVYAKGTREALLPFLPKIEVDALARIKDQEQFSLWFDKHTASIASILQQHDRGNSRIYPGIKWGHATKIMALFVRDLVLSSRHFSDTQAERIGFFLHVPTTPFCVRSQVGVGSTFTFTIPVHCGG